MTRWLRFAVALGLMGVLAAGCAHIVETPFDAIKIGMPREEAIQRLGFTPLSVQKDSTEYLLYQVIASFFALYSDTPNSVLFVRLEKGVVVAKGVVGKREAERIKQIDPAFDLRKLQGKEPPDL